MLTRCRVQSKHTDYIHGRRARQGLGHAHTTAAQGQPSVLALNPHPSIHPTPVPGDTGHHSANASTALWIHYAVILRHSAGVRAEGRDSVTSHTTIGLAIPPHPESSPTL